MSWVRIGDLADPAVALDPRERAALRARSVTELAVARALAALHGPELGRQRYLEQGGIIRYRDDGEPVIWTGRGQPDGE